MAKHPPNGPQRAKFLSGEGDAWFARNRSKLAGRGAEDDPVVRSLIKAGIKPQQVLEVGCSNGWRLSLVADRWGAVCQGVDPSLQAVEQGNASHPDLKLFQATADRLPQTDASVDLLIFGFCLYLADRGDLFAIAAEADRVLADGGHLAIYDFDCDSPHTRAYAHLPGLFSYKFRYEKMFLWNPAYSLVAEDVTLHDGATGASVDDRVVVTLLKKDASGAWPER